MAESVRRYDAAATVAGEARPPLRVVRDAPPQAVEPSAQGEARAWRAAAIGATAGFTITAVVITIVGTLAGIGSGGAFGLAVFVGAFGGVGFGFMMGGMASLGRELGAHPIATVENEQGENR